MGNHNIVVTGFSSYVMVAKYINNMVLEKPAPDRWKKKKNTNSTKFKAMEEGIMNSIYFLPGSISWLIEEFHSNERDHYKPISSNYNSIK